MNSNTSFECNFMDRIASRRRVAFVQACWHKEIIDQCKTGFLSEMASCGFSRSDIDLYEVPGAFELPLHAKKLSQTGRYGAIVAAGLVVDGGIYRHDFVAQAVIDGFMKVQLETGIPITSAVLTPHNFREGGEHATFFLQHLFAKGMEAAGACISTMQKLSVIEQTLAGTIV